MNSTTRNIVIGLALLVVIAVVAVFGFGALSPRTEPVAEKAPVEQPVVAEKPVAVEKPAATLAEKKMVIKKVDVKIPEPNPHRRFACGKDEVVFITDKNNNGMLVVGERSYPVTLDLSATNARYKTIDGFKPAVAFSAIENKAVLEGEDGRVDCTLVTQVAPEGAVPAASATQTAAAVAPKPTETARADTAVVAADAVLEAGVWQAVEFNGKPLAADAVITMQLTDGRIAGKSACNRYTGPYSTDAESRSLKITGPVAGTRMACAPALMETEVAFNEVLPKITAYKLEDGPVLVVFAGTEEVLRLTPAQPE